MKEKKGFANLQYPGIKIDPMQDSQDLPLDLKEKLKNQIQKIGLEIQKKIFNSSVLVAVNKSSDLNLTRLLLEMGFGRVGLFIENHFDNEKKLDDLLKKARSNYPIIHFEKFKGISVDRSLEDIARGFQFIFNIGSMEIVLPLKKTIITVQQSNESAVVEFSNVLTLLVDFLSGKIKSDFSKGSSFLKVVS